MAAGALRKDVQGVEWIGVAGCHGDMTSALLSRRYDGLNGMREKS
jgi:hypothetical protein